MAVLAGVASATVPAQEALLAQRTKPLKTNSKVSGPITTTTPSVCGSKSTGLMSPQSSE